LKFSTDDDTITFESTKVRWLNVTFG
jgi:hypothetical protein